MAASATVVAFAEVDADVTAALSVLFRVEEEDFLPLARRSEGDMRGGSHHGRLVTVRAAAANEIQRPSPSGVKSANLQLGRYAHGRAVLAL